MTQLTKHNGGEFSASLISFGDGRRMVIVNDAHSLARQNSDIAHEIGHTLLAHPLEVLSSMIGCRDFDPDLEDEATHFAGYLLVPNETAWSIFKSGMDMEIAQTTYGVSRPVPLVECIVVCLFSVCYRGFGFGQVTAKVAIGQIGNGCRFGVAAPQRLAPAPLSGPYGLFSGVRTLWPADMGKGRKWRPAGVWRRPGIALSASRGQPWAVCGVLGV